jgi:hypothetical protein
VGSPIRDNVALTATVKRPPRATLGFVAKDLRDGETVSRRPWVCASSGCALRTGSASSAMLALVSQQRHFTDQTHIRVHPIVVQRLRHMLATLSSSVRRGGWPHSCCECTARQPLPPRPVKRFEHAGVLQARLQGPIPTLTSPVGSSQPTRTCSANADQSKRRFNGFRR